MSTGTAGEEESLIQGYTHSPTPEKSADIFEKAKEKLGPRFGYKGNDAASESPWPAPSKPHMTGATYKNEDGQPIEGPTQPMSQDTKKEGLMTKLMDKLHIHEKSSSPRASSSPTANTGTPGTNSSADTDIPMPTAGGPSSTQGTASGPTEN